jgi:hypothetical protein
MKTLNMKTVSIVATAGLLAFAVACTPKPTAEQLAAEEAASASSQSSMMSSVASDAAASAVAKVYDVSTFLGQWKGPEATALSITQIGATYAIAITNLDGTRNFSGVPVPDGLSFERDGATYVIHKGNGAQTGMKWLAEKTDCLVVVTGEGYCRD